MKPALKKFFAVSLVCVMVASFATSCGKSTTSGTASSSTASATSAPVSTQIKLPIVDKPLTLSMHQSADSAVTGQFKTYGETRSMQELEKRTNIHIDFIHFPGTTYDENVKLLMASKQLPDIFEYAWAYYNGGPAKAVSDGIIVDLNDLVKTNAPNIQKYFKEDPVAGKLCKTDEGKMYMFPMSNGPAVNQVAAGPQIRQDWLDKLNLKMPTNADEWYTVLKAFKEKDPNGNGKADEIPFIADKNGVFGYLLYGNGTPSGFYQENGQVKLGVLDPAYKSYLQIINKWYKEGLVDQDYMVNDTKTIQAKVIGNQAGSWETYVGRMKTYYDMLVPTVPTAKIAGTPIPTFKAGETPKMCHNQGIITGLRGAGITPNCKDKEAAVKWLDYLYSPEGSNLVLWGIEGESYTKDANGKIKLTDAVTNPPDKQPLANALAKFGGLAFVKFEYVRPAEYMYYLSPMKEQQDALNTWLKTTENKRHIPLAQPLADDASRYNTIMTDANTYMAEMENKFIMGQESLDNFDKYIAKLKELRVEEAVKMIQKSLDAFNKR